MPKNYQHITHIDKVCGHFWVFIAHYLLGYMEERALVYISTL